MLLALAVVLTAGGCGASRPVGAEITAFEPASGVYEPGDEVVSTVRLRNTGPEKETFWIGYSVRDTGGHWHDAPTDRVTLEGGASTTRNQSWHVPDNPPPPSGAYDVTVAVWSARPGSGEGERLAGAERSGTFRVAGLREDFYSLDGDRWKTSAKELGRGKLDPANVGVADGRLALKIPAGTLDGGEIQSRELYRYGSYRARLKVANAPSSITGFFLYYEPDFESEIDVEVHNDPSGRILFTTYSGGAETNTVRKSLPFDPTTGFHEYRFDLYPDRADFYADGERLHTFDTGLPDGPMRLMVNTWFPSWLAGEKPKRDRYTYVDWIRH